MRRVNDQTLPRFGAIHRAAVRAEWDAAIAAGLELVIRDGDGLLFGAAPGIDSRVYNRALGLAEQPARIPEALAFFAEHGVTGEVSLDPADVPPGAEPTVRLEAYLGLPWSVRLAPVDGLTIRAIEPDEVDAWTAAIIASYKPTPDMAALWTAMSPHLAGNPSRRLLLGSLADLDDRVVAAGSIQLTDDGAWISWAGVIPEARGRGIQRAMIAARCALATELGCERIAAWALAGEHSSANLARAGLTRIGERVSVRSTDLG
jgi:GNAT superfamily N-acetyltransferase